MATKSIYDMTQEEAIAYLRGLEGIQNIGTVTQTGGTNEYDPYFYKDASGRDVGVYGGSPGGYAPLGEAGYMEIPRDPNYVEGGAYTRGLTPMFDPNYAGGTYGHYEGVYDSQGNLVDVQFKKDERHQGFLAENLEWIGPLAVGGAMAGGALAGGLGGAGAGVTEAALGELGINTALPAGTAGGVSGITEAALGELGINTSLPMGTPGGVYAPSGIESLLGDEVLTGSAEYLPGLDIPPGAEPQIYDIPPVEGPVPPPTVTPPTGATPPTMDIPPGAEPQNYGIEPGPAAPSGGITDVLKTLGVNSVQDALRLGLLGSGLASILGGGSRGGSGTGGGVTNLVTPYTFNRTVNPQAKPLSSADAYAYLRGQPSPTTGQPVSTGQQKWFDESFTARPTYNPATGEQYVTDPATGRLVRAATPATTNTTDQDTATGANGGIVALAQGGGFEGSLGSYSDGGRLLRGPGDGVSDSIPATIAGKHPARLADGEFVVPARIVSELGNGSTEAGARKLYAMMDRIQAGRKKTVGKQAIAKDSKADKHLPA